MSFNITRSKKSMNLMQELPHQCRFKKLTIRLIGAFGFFLGARPQTPSPSTTKYMTFNNV